MRLTTASRKPFRLTARNFASGNLFRKFDSRSVSDGSSAAATAASRRRHHTHVAREAKPSAALTAAVERELVRLLKAELRRSGGGFGSGTKGRRMAPALASSSGGAARADGSTELLTGGTGQGSGSCGFGGGGSNNNGRGSSFSLEEAHTSAPSSSLYTQFVAHQMQQIADRKRHVEAAELALIHSLHTRSSEANTKTWEAMRKRLDGVYDFSVVDAMMPQFDTKELRVVGADGSQPIQKIRPTVRRRKPTVDLTSAVGSAPAGRVVDTATLHRNTLTPMPAIPTVSLNDSTAAPAALIDPLLTPIIPMGMMFPLLGMPLPLSAHPSTTDPMTATTTATSSSCAVAAVSIGGDQPILLEQVVSPLLVAAVRESSEFKEMAKQRRQRKLAKVLNASSSKVIAKVLSNSLPRKALDNISDTLKKQGGKKSTNGGSKAGGKVNKQLSTTSKATKSGKGKSADQKPTRGRVKA